MTGLAALRRLSGLAAFVAIWALALVAGFAAGEYWFWLGLLFGWIPGIVASNLAEKLWPLFLVAAAAAAWLAFRT